MKGVRVQGSLGQVVYYSSCSCGQSLGSFAMTTQRFGFLAVRNVLICGCHYSSANTDPCN